MDEITPAEDIRRIVVGYDDTEPAKRALERAAQLAAASGAQIRIVSVARPFVVAGHGVGPVDPVDPPELHREQVAHAAARLAELGLEADSEVVLGEPAREIVRLAEQEQADLIVVGTREPDFLERLFGLSVSESVERRAHCDVLIVH